MAKITDSLLKSLKKSFMGAVNSSKSKPKEKEESSDVNSYLKIIAKNFIIIPNIARDINVTRQNVEKLVKLEGGKPSSKADAFFLREDEKEEKLEVERKKTEKPKATIEKVKKLFDPENWIEAIVKGIVKGILLAIGGVFIAQEYFKDFFDNLFASVSDAISGMVDYFKELGSSFIESSKEVFNSLLDKAKEFIQTYIDPILNVVSDIVDNIKEKISGFLQNIGDFVADKVKILADFLEPIIKFIGDKIIYFKEKFPRIAKLFGLETEDDKKKRQQELDKRENERIEKERKRKEEEQRAAAEAESRRRKEEEAAKKEKEAKLARERAEKEQSLAKAAAEAEAKKKEEEARVAREKVRKAEEAAKKEKVVPAPKPAAPPSAAPKPTPVPAPAAPPPVVPKPAPTPAPAAPAPKPEPMPTPEKISGADEIKNMIIRHEGIVPYPYLDSKGYWTIGVGHLMNPKNKTELPPGFEQYKNNKDAFNKKNNKTPALSNDEIRKLFDEDFEHHKKIAEKGPGYDKANDKGKGAFIDLSFNLGAWWTIFKKAGKKAAEGDFSGASEELKDSAWFTQVGNRAKEIVGLVAQAGSPDGESIGSSSTEVSSGQRQQAKPSNPNVVNMPITKNTQVVRNETTSRRPVDASRQAVSRAT